MSAETSILRLYLLRALYLLNFVLGLSYIWPWLIGQKGVSDPWQAVGFSLYAALFTLSGLGLRYPLKMLPLLLLQLFYKATWLSTVALPLWIANQSSSFTKDMVVGLVLDVIVIPWPYVLQHFLMEQGDRWRRHPRGAVAG